MATPTFPVTVETQDPVETTAPLKVVEQAFLSMPFSTPPIPPPFALLAGQTTWKRIHHGHTAPTAHSNENKLFSAAGTQKRSSRRLSRHELRASAAHCLGYILHMSVFCLIWTAVAPKFTNSSILTVELEREQSGGSDLCLRKKRLAFCQSSVVFLTDAVVIHGFQLQKEWPRRFGVNHLLCLEH